MNTFRTRLPHHRRRRVPPGSPPGTLVPDPNESPPRISVIAYGPDDLVEADVERIADLPPYLSSWPVTWVNVDGLGDVGVLQELGALFGLHRLALEDVINLHQRAKVDDYGERLFLVTHMASLAAMDLQIEQMSMFVGPAFLLTFQHLPGDCLGPVRLRLRGGNGNLRRSGPDYLAYALIDAALDGFFPVLEVLGERLEELEVGILDDPTPATRHQIHQIRHGLLSLRRTIWPQREALNQLVRDPIPLVAPETRVYLRDAYDHVIQLIDLVEAYREFASDLTDLYLSSVSTRMNEVVKVLTIISTIFIPLSFVAGVYGMNFDTTWPWNMPELGWRFGYLLALGLMAAVAAVLLAYFRRRDWL
jgi:magnesium transporter